MTEIEPLYGIMGLIVTVLAAVAFFVVYNKILCRHLEKQAVERTRKKLKSVSEESTRSNRLWTMLIDAIWFVLDLVVRWFLPF
jgi:Na+/melibiose symporter-like transporter